MLKFKEQTWDDGLLIRELTADERQQLIEPHHKVLFSGQSPRFDPESIYTNDEREKVDVAARRLNLGAQRILIGAFYKSEFAGWHFGRQVAGDTYQMTNSAVLPQFRRKKIYERLLVTTMQAASSEGYQVVTSRHHPTNVAVIIPKLKAGFVISGMEVTDTFGTLITLSWFPNGKRQAVFAFRTGYTYPSVNIDQNVLNKQADE